MSSIRYRKKPFGPRPEIIAEAVHVNSALLAVHAVAILPEEMSKERFEWLKQIGAEVYATHGCESNVKEIYDKCHELEKESDEYLIFNQFDQFGNSIWHYEITGSTIETLFNQIKRKDKD